MTSRQRLLTVLSGGIPDCVPVAPDISNMIPARLTGKPFWDLYLYNDPPIWECYIAAAKTFDIDSAMDGYFWMDLEDPKTQDPTRERFIVHKDERMIVTQWSWLDNGKRQWANTVDVYYVADSPTCGVPLEKVNIGLPDVPTRWEPLEGVQSVDHGPAGLQRVKNLMGDQGLVGIFIASTSALRSPDAIYEYYDHPEKHELWAQQRVEEVEKKFARLLASPVQPDFLCVGGSGTLIFQTMDIFQQLAWPAVKRGIELATANGFMTHVHSCGPEAALVKFLAENSSLTVIDPLEISPMGDCDLKQLKRLYGHKLTLKGNLHTTNVMLRGSVADVVAASKQAIDDAAEGGRFILSTGDQCGRDTPYDNLRAMVDTARTYGRYKR